MPHALAKAFTVLELSVCVLLLAVLAILLFSASGRITEHSHAITCTNRIRQIGILFNAYVGENNGRSRLFVGGNIGMDEYGWYNILKQKANLNDNGAQKAFGCPSLSPNEVRNWYCYGFRAEGAPGYNEPINDGEGGVYNLHVAAVQDPSKFLMVADTANSNLKKQSFRFLRTKKDPNSRIHLRHMGRANGLFLDGHIRLLDATDLHTAGVTEAYDKDGAIIKTKP